jgi:putative membrane protein
VLILKLKTDTMKKTILFSIAIASLLSFQACNNAAKTKTDSVEAAEDSNEIVSNNVKEDDSDFMIKAANGGMMEVEAGKLAQQNAASPDVKDFGARMIADHTKAGDELKAMATAKNVVLPATLGEDEQKHLNDMTKMKGADFDKHYIDMMVKDHDKTVSMFEDAAKNANDADVRTWASNILPTLKEHDVAVKAIKDKMK